MKKSFRTDLACESRDVWLRTRGAALAGVSARQETRDGLGVETVEILDEEAAEELCKPTGRYVTISLDALVRREEDAFRRACGVLAREIRTQLAMEPEESVLVVGLGNPDITPDAVGPLAAECVLVTRHLKTRLPEEFAAFRPVSVFRTGVLGTTGIESAALVRGVVSLVRPDRVIAVDALSGARGGAALPRGAGNGCGHRPRLRRRQRAQRSHGGNARRSGRRCRGADGRGCAHALRRPLRRGGLIFRRIRSFSSRRGISTPACATAPGLVGYAIDLALHDALTIEDIDMFLALMFHVKHQAAPFLTKTGWFHVKHLPKRSAAENVSRETSCKMESASL